MKSEFRHLPIDDIHVGKRFRQDMGDLKEIAESMKDILLQPIGVTPGMELIFGERRLLAAKSLGWTTILARIIDVPSILESMLTEDTMRKDFTVSERVAIYQAVKDEIGNRQGQRTDRQPRDNCPEVGERTDDYAAKRAGLGNRKSAERAEKVIQSGVPELIQAMDNGELSISAAADVASLPPKDQKRFLSRPMTHDKVTARQVRKCHKLRRIKKEQDKERRAIVKLPHKRAWTLTGDQDVVPCDCVVTDPPQGILPEESWDNPPEGIEAFTRDWCRRWSKCGANYIAIFWNQKTKWVAKHWFDESLEGYEFLQECCCHRRNYKKPERMNGPHKKLRNSWEPVFIYCRKGVDRGITQSNHALSNELTDNDHHSASYPTVAQNGDSFQQHKCQKPASVFRWLIHALALPGELVVDPFCGSGTSGIAAVQLGRRFLGIETDKRHRRIAEGRLAMFAKPPAPSRGRKLKINTLTQGDCLGLIPLLPDGSINQCLTSPPYAEQRADHYASISEDEYPEFTLRWMTALEPKLTENGSVLIVLDPHVKDGEVADYVLWTQLLLRLHGWMQHQSLIWQKLDRLALGHKEWPRHCYEQVLWFSKSHKPFCDPWAAGTPSDRIGANNYGHSLWTPGKQVRSGIARITDVIVAPVGGNEKDVDHPAQFPIALVEPLVKTFCPKGGTVLDPFAGSGTTLLAAKHLGRKWYGFEIDGKYCEHARRRIGKQQAVGKAG